MASLLVSVAGLADKEEGRSPEGPRPYRYRLRFQPMLLSNSTNAFMRPTSRFKST